MDLRTERLRRLAVEARRAAGGGFWRVDGGVWKAMTDSGDWEPIDASAMSAMTEFSSYAAPNRVIDLIERITYLESLVEGRGAPPSRVRRPAVSAERVHHDHFTRDIKPRGKCPACDLTWARYDEARQDEAAE